jgi:hypothetical protein
LPAASVSSLNSWAVYLLSALGLLLMVSPQLVGTVHDSRESADWRNLDGVRAAVDALAPGEVINLTYGSMSTSDPIRLAGHQLSCSYGNGTLAFASRWQLPDLNLTASTFYLVWLSGGEVQVARAG